MNKDLEEFGKDLDRALGMKPKKQTPSKVVKPAKITNINLNELEDFNCKVKEVKRLKIIGWVASSLSIIGIIMNAYLIIWCWAVWIISDFVWIYWAVKKKEWSQVFLWVVFILANLYGWFLWATM